jgi:hypothetical protein
MRTFAAGVLQRGPRRSQLGKVARPDRRGELSAGLAAIALVTELLIVPAAVAVSLVLLAVARLSRWRPDWLLLPVLVGVGWLAAAGPRWAATSVAVGPRQLVSGLMHAAANPSRLLRDPGGAAAAAVHALPRELPAALVAGAVQAGLLTWLGFRRRHESWRPGLLAASRRWRGRALLAAGQTVTATGCAFGLDAHTGRLAGLSWAEVERGVLLTGTDPGELSPVVLAVACAALRRRKTVLTLDLGGDRDAAALAGAVALAAASLGLPVRRVSRPDGAFGIAVGRAIRARGVLLASGSGALLCGQVTGVLACLRERGLRGDGLLCVSGCEAVDHAMLADLLALGRWTGTAMLASTTSAECAEALACHVGQTVVCGPVSQEVAARLIPSGIPADGGLSPGTAALARQRRGEFTLLGPGRTWPRCQAVPIMIPVGSARVQPALAALRRAHPVPADVPTAAGSR